MYTLIALSFIVSLLARGDFLGILIGIYVFILFLYQGGYETAKELKRYLQINFAAVIYDLLWIIFHFSGYWNGNEYEHAELSLKRWTYFFSFLNFLVKIVLLISVWISYDKVSNSKKGGKKSLKQVLKY